MAPLTRKNQLDCKYLLSIDYIEFTWRYTG